MSTTASGTNHSGVESRKLVVVLGHQRSGNSAVASLLSRATGLTLVDDPTWTFARHVRKVYGNDQRIDDYLRDHDDDLTRGILKAPSLTPIARNLEHVLPAAQFVVIVRDPRDNIAAIFEWRRHRDPTASDNFWNNEWLGIETNNRTQLLAQRWNAYLDAASQLANPIWFSYEAFFRDKHKAVLRLCDELHIPPVKSISGFQNEQFKKDFGDQQIRGVGRWKRDLSAEDVQIIDQLCGDRFRNLDLV